MTAQSNDDMAAVTLNTACYDVSVLALNVLSLLATTTPHVMSQQCCVELATEQSSDDMAAVTHEVKDCKIKLDNIRR